MNLKPFTKSIAKSYQEKASQAGNDCQDIGKRRELRFELQREYGLTEIEAVNVLNGFNIADIVVISAKRMEELQKETQTGDD